MEGTEIFYRRPILSGQWSMANKSLPSLRLRYQQTGKDNSRGQIPEPCSLILLARYDMLCFEGISLMLNIFRGKQTSPNYRLVPPPSGELEVLTCDETVCIQRATFSYNRLTQHRHHKSDPSFQAQYYGISNSPKQDTNLSLLFKINFTKTLLVSGPW